MKYLILMLGAGLLVTGHARAQVGGRAGGALAGYAPNTNNYFRNTTGSQLGYQIGAFYRVPLSPRLFIVPEVQYSNERLTLTRSNDVVFEGGYNSYYRTHLSYLNVPVLVQARYGPVYAEAGAQASALLGGRETGEATIGGTATTAGSTYRIDRGVVGRYQRYDVGPAVGVGVELPAGLGVSVRFYRGLRSLAQDVEADTGYLYRRTVQASLTYQLPGRPRRSNASAQ